MAIKTYSDTRNRKNQGQNKEVIEEKMNNFRREENRRALKDSDVKMRRQLLGQGARRYFPSFESFQWYFLSHKVSNSSSVDDAASTHPFPGGIPKKCWLDKSQAGPNLKKRDIFLVAMYLRAIQRLRIMQPP
jgi:hypothetical protein